MASLSELTASARAAAETLAERATGLVAPSLRLGVTGLSRSGKTVFLTSLVHNLVHGGRLPLFKPYAEGRLKSAMLQPQPDDAVPRFAYEAHVRDLVERLEWPQSTRRISELRVTIEFESAHFFQRQLGAGRLHFDLVDYPGEWLLDLPLATKDYPTWCREALAQARRPRRAAEAAAWLAALGRADPNGPADEDQARALAAAFTAYLKAVRGDPSSLAALPPGRFLMPGDLEGSPALTFAPLDLAGGTIAPGSLAAMMARRFEAYKAHIIRPFFRDHFARLDRQVVLVDLLSALNRGPQALAELETVLADVLACFRVGRLNWLSSLVDRRIDRILFAATKADHVHQDDHDRLEAILDRLVQRARERAASAGAQLDTAAIAAVRATREATVKHKGQPMPALVGTPMPGETLNGTRFDGEREIALFPGDLPSDPNTIFQDQPDHEIGVTYLRFRPPRLETTPSGSTLSLPHIRLDRALQYLIGDRLE